MQPSQQTDRRVCHSEPRRVCRRGAGMGRSASAPASATGGALEARHTRLPSDDRYELWAFPPPSGQDYDQIGPDAAAVVPRRLS